MMCFDRIDAERDPQRVANLPRCHNWCARQPKLFAGPDRKGNFSPSPNDKMAVKQGGRVMTLSLDYCRPCVESLPFRAAGRFREYY